MQICKVKVIDSVYLVCFINMVVDDLLLYFWCKFVGFEGDLWVLGCECVVCEIGNFFYSNVWLVQIDGEVVVCLLGYVVEIVFGFIVFDMLLIFVLLLQFEVLVLGLWYLNVLVIYLQFCGKGLGGVLLVYVEIVVVKVGYDMISLIVVDMYQDVLWFYIVKGYFQVVYCFVVKGDWQVDVNEWILFIKFLFVV